MTRRDCARSRWATPTSGFINDMPGGGLQQNSGAPSNPKSTGNTTSFESKPICARFGRKETGRLQRPEIGPSAVSVVWSTSLNPFEYKRISGAPSTPARVCNEVMAEGKELASNSLLASVPNFISPSARQVRIEIVAPGHRRYRRPALVRLRYDPPLLVFRAHPPPASSGGVWSRN